jgi:hypothetical protein
VHDGFIFIMALCNAFFTQLFRRLYKKRESVDFTMRLML